MARSEVYLNIFGNVCAGGHDGGTGIGIRKQGTVSTTNDFGIYDAPGGATLNSPPSNADVVAFINGLNPGAVGGTTVTHTNRATLTAEALNVDATAGAGVTATASGSLVVKGAGNSITSTTSTASPYLRCDGLFRLYGAPHRIGLLHTHPIGGPRLALDP
jgi:hypothetical protein